MNSIYCPQCNNHLSLNRVQPLEPGTINPYGYDFHCEHCTCTVNGRDYLQFFGSCYADREIKNFILRFPLQDEGSFLMMEVLKDRHSIRCFKAAGSYTFLEEKTFLTPKEAYIKLIRIKQLIAFT
jgi:hypothetical protein